MEHLEACDHLPSIVARYAAAVRDADVSTPVPSCPGWDLRKLTRHVGTTQRWAAEMVRRRATERLDQRTLDLGLPADDRGYADWILAGGEQLVAALRAADGDDGM